jgi:hypothetical protein
VFATTTLEALTQKEEAMKNVETSTGTKLSMSIKKIGPEAAKQFLLGCQKNRAPLKSRIRRYAQGMTNDEWVVAQPLLFDHEGSLIDGQHRMQAVILSKKTVEFLIVKGYDRDLVFGKLDDVGKRTLRDWLHIMGVNEPKVTAGVVNWAARDAAGLIPSGGGSNFHLTAIEGVEFLEENPEIHESVKGRGVRNVILPRVMSAFAHWKFSAKDKTLANTFFIDLIMGEKEGDGDPIYLLRERMKSDKLAKTKLKSNEKLALVIKAWNAVREGKTLHNLRWRSTGPTAESWPEVL